MYSVASVCLSVCLSVCDALTFDSLGLESCEYICDGYICDGYICGYIWYIYVRFLCQFYQVSVTGAKKRLSVVCL